MGFFSWKTCDTDRSIANNSSDRETFTVHMITPKGQVFTEVDYDGYGVFGGMDYYELLGVLNGKGPNRSAGIDLSFKGNSSGDDTPGVVYPKFVETLGKDPAKQYDSLPNPVSCEDQGFFYGDDEDDDDDDDYEDDREDDREDEED